MALEPSVALMESQFIEWLRRRLDPHPCLRLGPGDDAAVLQIGQDADAVVTVDLLVDGVHFELDKVSPARIGHKALAVNLSDLAAMASRPLAVVIALALPREGGLELAQQVYEGMLPLADRYQIAIAGGDTNSWNGPLVISVTAIGRASHRGVLARSGARPGDVIVVTGALGGSILDRHLDVEPRCEEALMLHERYDLHAGIDISDGLALDLSRVARESGCGAALELAKIPISPAAHQLAANGPGPTALDHALSDGEDFELILAVPALVADQMLADRPLRIPLNVVGKFVEQPGLWEITEGGLLRALEVQGYEH